MKKPYFWKARKAWYFNDASGKHVRLDADELTAHTLWTQIHATAAPDAPNAPFYALVEHYLGYLSGRVTAKTYEQIKKYLFQFCCFLPSKTENVNCGEIAAKKLKPFHVTKWLDANKTWVAADTKRSAIAAVKGCLNWSKEQGYIETSPLDSLKKPEGNVRSQLVDETAHAKMMAVMDDRRQKGRAFGLFRQVLIALKHSGARPGMVAAVTFEDIEQDGAVWSLKKHKTMKKTKAALRIYPTPCLQTLVKIIASKRTTGPVFLNSKGDPWKVNAIQIRLRKLRTKAKLPKTVVPYCYRHTYATTALENGTDIATVAELLGHKDATMVMKVYGHLSQKHQYMSDAAANVHKKKPKAK